MFIEKATYNWLTIEKIFGSLQNKAYISLKKTGDIDDFSEELMTA